MSWHQPDATSSVGTSWQKRHCRLHIWEKSPGWQVARGDSQKALYCISTPQYLYVPNWFSMEQWFKGYFLDWCDGCRDRSSPQKSWGTRCCGSTKSYLPWRRQGDCFLHGNAKADAWTLTHGTWWPGSELGHVPCSMCWIYWKQFLASKPVEAQQVITSFFWGNQRKTDRFLNEVLFQESGMTNQPQLVLLLFDPSTTFKDIILLETLYQIFGML